METEDIDFETLQQLKSVPSKKYLRKLLEYCFLIRNKLLSFEQFYQTPVATQFHTDFELSESQSHIVTSKPIKCIFVLWLSGLIMSN